MSEKQKQTSRVNAAKEKLAEMEVNESFVQKAEFQRRIRRQSDLEDKHGGIDRNEDSSEGEKFTGLDDMESSCSEALEVDSDFPSNDGSEQPQKKRGVAVSFGLHNILTWN